jgi:hypothetical protein
VAKVSIGTQDLSILKTEEPIQVNGQPFKNKKSNGLVLEPSNSQMALNIKVRQRKVFSMAKEEWLTPTEMFTKENGKMEKPVDKEFSSINKDPCMRAPGRTINITEKVLNNGIIIKSFTKETLSMDKRLEKVNLSSMETFMKETLLMENSTEKENTTSPSQEKSIKVNFKKIICMEKEKWLGLMELIMREASLMERQKDMELELTLTEIKSQVSSRTTKSMDLQFFTKHLRWKKCKLNTKTMFSSKMLEAMLPPQLLKLMVTDLNQKPLLRKCLFKTHLAHIDNLQLLTQLKLEDQKELWTNSKCMELTQREDSIPTFQTWILKHQQEEILLPGEDDL